MKQSRNAQQAAALSRKIERQQAHAAMMAAHAAKKVAWNRYVEAFDAWVAAGERGPKPVDPRTLPVSA
jgi:uncharacterized protein with beta-barrel porin domain